jgi:hypothetical protein
VSAKAKKPAKKAVKASKPAKTVPKGAVSKVAKAVKKVAKLALKPVKLVATKKKGEVKLKEDKKKVGKETVAKSSQPKASAVKSIKTTPKTLLTKEAVVEESATDSKLEGKTVKDVILTDAEGRILCRVKDCDQPAVVENYCRYHYLFFWKKIQNRKKILSEGKLEQYIEELTSRYPLKFLELIRKDLGSEPDFLSAIQELDIDEASTNVDDFEDENFMEEVRGIGSGDTERVDDEY